ncbi:helix-hairpin-helix domain-containing protein [Mucilaginibacter ginsenosidivorax]|uniref:Helix-hairpin-helix domain-containing protein n=1 Tax=Mucilaginibacter ginsenosidivorax TaxID=862126 RepID=A0A5B8W2I1_9SPHI|nr:helix-hairpin-helix domain-containing protein [Mucilaginibacter ginsenosidivorax]QEC78054.1 helix-hairpin-helix domain-containing protein [Mucilaginibacter ginsenosidivorax]
MKDGIKSYLSITKKEWNGMAVLVIIIALILAAPFVYQASRKDNTINFKEFDKAAAMLSKTDSTGSASNGPKSGGKELKIKLFAFNPNNLPEADWERLGLSADQVKVIKNYEAKGGRFYAKADVKKIYTITGADYQRLEPYINLPAADNYTKKAAPGEIIEINGADSAKLTMIRGIGPSFARRIIRYRDRLGGFYSKEQLKEVFGVDDSKYAEIKNGIAVNGSHITKLNVNNATFDQLRRFPYLSFKQINAIIEYHNQHGDYESTADMKNIAILDDGILRKIGPYLVFK